MSDDVTLEEAGEATVVRMDDGKVNALSVSFLDVLGDRVAEALDGGGPVVVTGNDRIFSAGLDLNEVPKLDADGLAELIGNFGDVLEPILREPVPVVAALPGHAIAGGAILALACDHRVAAPEAEIGATEMEIGIPFPPTDIALFTSRLPSRTIRRTIVDPRRVAGEQALDLGWVDEVADDPLQAGLAVADRLGGTNPEGFEIMKRELNRSVIEAWDGFSGDDHVDQYVDLLTSETTREAVLEGIAQTMG